MKNLVVTTLALVLNLSLAQASSMQENCSNADATVSMKMGHFESGLYLTKRTYDGKNGSVREQKIEVSLRDQVTMEHLESQQIHNESYNGCEKPGSGPTAGAWYKSVNLQKVKITKQDGSAFEDGILAVSADRKSIGVYLLCERIVTNIISCTR